MLSKLRYKLYNRINCRNIYNKLNNNILTINMSTNDATNTTVDNSNIDFTEIVEGSARMFYNNNEEVFYNKVQVLNRDLSIQVIKLFSEIIINERNILYQKKLDSYNNKKINNRLTEHDKEPYLNNNGITILDGLAATGLRSIRYLKEINNITKLTINDLSIHATQTALKNCELNDININNDKIEISNKDATLLMYEHRDKLLQYDVIDIDPFGSASPFLDSAVQAVSNGGLLCITCTDSAILSGVYPEVCYAKYGSIPLKTKYYHEMAIRILLNSIESNANKYKRYIVPWLSLSVDFYVRVFVRVYESATEVKNSCLKRINVLQAIDCPSFYIKPIATRNYTKKQKFNNNNDTDASATSNDNKTITNININESIMTTTNGDMWFGFTPPHLIEKPANFPNGNYSAPIISSSHDSNEMICQESGSKLKLGGPYWGQHIHHTNIIKILLQRIKDSNTTTTNTNYPIATADRLIGILTTMSQELEVGNAPFYYSLPEMASTLRVTTPSHLEFMSALVNAGYKVSQFHHEATVVKTNAPNSVVWDIMRCYCLKNGISTKSDNNNNDNKNDSNNGSVSNKKNKSTLQDRILSKKPTIEANFQISKTLIVPSNARVSRFHPNPEKNWGPKSLPGNKKKASLKRLNSTNSNNDDDTEKRPRSN